MSELQTCILKSVLEKKLSAAKVLFDSMHERFLRVDLAKRDIVILDKINNPREFEENTKPGWKRDSGGVRTRNSQQKKAKIVMPAPLNNLPVAIYGHFPAGLTNCKSNTELKDWYRKEKDRIMKIKYDQLFDGKFTTADIDWDNVSKKIVRRNIFNHNTTARILKSLFLDGTNEEAAADTGLQKIF